MLASKIFTSALVHELKESQDKVFKFFLFTFENLRGRLPVGWALSTFFLLHLGRILVISL